MVAGLPSISIRRNTNRSLKPEEAVEEGVKNLLEQTSNAQGFANKAERLGNFPTQGEVKEAEEYIGFSIDSLKVALKAAESVQQNLKRML